MTILIFLFLLGHGRRVYATTSSRKCRSDSVSESTRDSREGGEDPQAHHQLPGSLTVIVGLYIMIVRYGAN